MPDPTPQPADTRSNPSPPLAVIGAGTMASAIVDRALAAGVLDADRIVAADPNADRRDRYAHPAASPAEALDLLERLETPSAPGRVLLAVKPQVFPGVAADLADRFAAAQPSRLVVSVLAGVTADTIAKALGPAARVVRVMPNTPAQVGRGTAAIAPHPTATADDLDWTRALFAAVGTTVDLPEDLIDAFTGVAGSGPAYVFLLAEALTDAGIAVGLDPETAAAIARSTVAGAGALLDADPRSAANLRVAVTSKKGTTAAAIDTFEAGDLRGLVTRAVTAARDRGRELGRELGRDPD